jgi:hypothetical protein
MRLVHASTLAIAVALFLPAASLQGTPSQDADRKVAGGGILVKGWQGKVDAGNKQGLTINDSKFAAEGNGFRITTGPATTYWNPSNTAKGDFTVKATFREPKQTYSHPHPFGVFIAGKALDSEAPTMLYCVAQRSGEFVIRHFADGKVNTLVRRTPHAAVNKATGPEAEVTQEVGWVVKGGKADCVVNGQVVHSIDKADPAATVKFDSFDGIYGIRTTHNSDVIVTGLGLSK